MHGGMMMLRRRRGFGYVDENGNAQLMNTQLVPLSFAEPAPESIAVTYEEPASFYEEPAALESEPVYEAEAGAYVEEPAASFDSVEPASFDYESAGGAESLIADGTHFASFVPDGGILEVQRRLAAWGRPKNYPSSVSTYGWDGPLSPGDFALVGSDLDGADSHRLGMAINSFQRWANTYRSAGLSATGNYDQATHNALVGETGIPVPTTFPTGGSGNPAIPPSGNVIAFPGGWASSGSSTNTSVGLPPKQPGATTGAKPTLTDLPWWVWALLAAGGLTVVFLVVRKRRKKAKAS